jgi:hypothetical protein
MDEKLHKRMLLMNRSIETLRLQKQENVRSDDPMMNKFAYEIKLK